MAYANTRQHCHPGQQWRYISWHAQRIDKIGRAPRWFFIVEMPNGFRCNSHLCAISSADNIFNRAMHTYPARTLIICVRLHYMCSIAPSTRHGHHQQDMGTIDKTRAPSWAPSTRHATLGSRDVTVVSCYIVQYRRHMQFSIRISPASHDHLLLVFCLFFARLTVIRARLTTRLLLV